MQPPFPHDRRMKRQSWLKRGLIYRPPDEHRWIQSHAQVPTPAILSTGAIRVYFGARDAHHRTSTIFIDVDAADPTKVLRNCDDPVLPLGHLGCFDDAGVMPSCVVKAGRQHYLYYTGWNTSTTVP